MRISPRPSVSVRTSHQLTPIGSSRRQRNHGPTSSAAGRRAGGAGQESGRRKPLDCRPVSARDEGSGRASRLLWTLDVIGHPHYSLLNGGLHAWLNDRHPVSSEAVRRPRSQYTVKFRDTVLADKNYIVNHLRDPNVVIVDTRAPDIFPARSTSTGSMPSIKHAICA